MSNDELTRFAYTLYLEVREEIGWEPSLDSYYAGAYYVGLSNSVYRLNPHEFTKEIVGAWLEGFNHGQSDRKLYRDS